MGEIMVRCGSSCVGGVGLKGGSGGVGEAIFFSKILIID